MEIKSISVTETRDWRQVRKEAQESGALEVLNNGQPDLYIVTPDIWEYLKDKGLLAAYEQAKLEKLQSKIARALEQSEGGAFSSATPEDVMKSIRAKRGRKKQDETV